MLKSLLKVLLVLWLVIACTAAADNQSGEHQGWRFFEFGIRGADMSENFVAATNDGAVIETIEGQLQLPENQRFLHINGAIDSTDGGHNLSWHWHFSPGQWVMAEMSIELCDGLPSMVEAALSYWLHTLGHFCPWASYVVEEITDGCCVGNRGNVNGDQWDAVNVSDITFLIEYLFGVPLGPIPPCPVEANANGDAEEQITVSDITYLVDYLFGIPLGPAPPACP